MPVDDHPVHESTKITSDFRYGCHNRKPFADSYYAPNRYLARDRRYQYIRSLIFEIDAIEIKHVMSTDCKYDLSHKDPACAGCLHGVKNEPRTE